MLRDNILGISYARSLLNGDDQSVLIPIRDPDVTPDNCIDTLALGSPSSDEEIR